MTIFVKITSPQIGVTDYASLIQAVQDWFARSDLGGFINYFVQVAEDRIYRDVFAMNAGRGVQPMETILSGTIANGSLALPTGYLGLKHALITIAGAQTFELQRRNAEFIYTQYPNRNPSGIPAYIAREAQNFIFGPFPDSNYTVTGVYWQRSNPLSGTNTQTWMTASIPSILLAACSAAAAVFIKDNEAAANFNGLYTQMMQSFMLADRAEEQSGSAFAMVAA
jgi:hypothetical protein